MSFNNLCLKENYKTKAIIPTRAILESTVTGEIFTRKITGSNPGTTRILPGYSIPGIYPANWLIYGISEKILTLPGYSIITRLFHLYPAFTRFFMTFFSHGNLCM